MKVCQLCAVDFTLQKFLLPLVDGMQKAGWKVVSVCSDGSAVVGMREKGYQVNIIHIARSMNPLKAIASIRKLIQFFRKERFDILHVHTPVAALIGRIAARVTGIPLVVYTAHGFYFHDDMPALKRNIHIALERFAARFTHLLFTQSAEDAQTAVDVGIMPQDKVFAIGNGVDVSLYDPQKIGQQLKLKTSFGIPGNGFVVGMIGRLVNEKGVVEFLNAAMRIAEKNKNVWFVLVGERLATDHAAGVDNTIKQAIAVLQDRLVLTGLRHDIPQVLAIMDLFCLPSWREGMPRTIIEAMMMAKPVLATNIRGSREIVVSGKTGILVPVRATERLADAMQRCIENPFWVKQLGIAGRVRAQELYDESKVISHQVEILARFAKEKNLLV